ncbi:uncharacterized protein [Epargyreus clarus]
MLSDESSSDSETGRFKGRSKPQDDQEKSSSRREDVKSSGRSRRPDSDRYRRDIERKRDERNNYDRRSRDRHRYSRNSPIRRRYSRDRSRRSPERIRHDRDSSGRSKPLDRRSSSRDRHKNSRIRYQKSPIPSRDVKEEIKGIISKREKSAERPTSKQRDKKSSSPEKEKRSEVHKPSVSETKKISSPIIIDENEDSDRSVEVQPGSYYNMIPAIVKCKSEESSEIDSSDDERLRAKLLNLEKELHKTKRRKHKKKHKKKSVRSDKEKGDASVEVSSTTDIQDNIKTETINLSDTTEVTSTQKCQKDSSEEGEILSDDSDQIDIDPSDLRHKLKRSSNRSDSNSQEKVNKDVCGPALPPHLANRFTENSSDVEGPALPPHLQKSKNIGPALSDDMRKVLAENSKEIVEYESSEEDGGYGPLPAGEETKLTDAHQRLEERALEMKIKSIDGQSLSDSKAKSREQWMLELPEGKAKYLGLEARSFRAKAGPDMSDRSSWTDTPEEKARKAAGVAKEEDADVALQREARARHIANRDEEQEKSIKKHKKKHKREESLLEIHQKKLKKKKKKEEKDEEKKERRPFNRDIDLQANRFDEAQKKSIIKKAQDLNSRFSRGEAKFL